MRVDTRMRFNNAKAALLLVYNESYAPCQLNSKTSTGCQELPVMPISGKTVCDEVFMNYLSAGNYPRFNSLDHLTAWAFEHHREIIENDSVLIEFIFRQTKFKFSPMVRLLSYLTPLDFIRFVEEHITNQPKEKKVRNPPDFEKPIQISIEDVFAFKAYYNWGQNTVGFGQMSLEVTNDGKTIAISGSPEGMNHKWIRKSLHAMIDAVMDALPADADRYDIDVSIPVKRRDDEDGFVELKDGDD